MARNNCSLLNLLTIGVFFPLGLAVTFANDPSSPTGLPPDGLEPGWQAMEEEDFVRVNCPDETWTWSGDKLYCTGEPIGVIRSRKPYEDFEFMVEWRHLKSGGNSGVFVWATEEALRDLPPGKLPRAGIEVQILDHGFTQLYESRTGKKGDWFTTHGDVFPVGTSEMTPFPPVSPNGERSFPSQNLSRGAGEWNHYYIRASDGEIRLWVNGVEVSGGSECVPSHGYLCLESEGSPIEFKNLKIRELP